MDRTLSRDFGIPAVFYPIPPLRASTRRPPRAILPPGGFCPGDRFAKPWQISPRAVPRICQGSAKMLKICQALAKLPKWTSSKGARHVKTNSLILVFAWILCLLFCACGRNPVSMLVEGLFAGPTSENVSGIYEGKNYGGEERIVLRKDGTFSHGFVRDGRVVVTNDGTWHVAEDSMEIVFSSANRQAWPGIPPDETADSPHLKIWERNSCSLTYYRDFGRKDVDKAANLFYSFDSPEEYWLWKTAETPEEPTESVP